MGEVLIMELKALGLCVALGFAVGCWRYAPDHCVSQDGDASCGSGMFCSGCEAHNNGCVAERPVPACHIPAPDPGLTSSSTGDEASEVSGGPTANGTSESATDSMTSGSTGVVGCIDDEDCPDEAAPFCGSEGECVGCDVLPDPNGACVGLGTQTPICSEGACVACDGAPEPCGGQTPVCSPDEGCRACAEHFECPSGACHLDGTDVGACFDMADVVSIANAAELAAAVAGLEVDDRAVLVLDPGFYPTTIDFGDSTEVAVIGSAFNPPILAGDGARSAEVFGNAIVYLSNVEVSNSNVAGDGIQCTGRSVWVDDSLLDGNRIGIAASSGCFVHARRTTVIQNTTRGIECSGADLSLRNSAVGLNGNGFTSAVGGLLLANTTVDIVYSSVVANQSSVPGEASMSCTGGELGEVRNSIIVSTGGGVGGCAGITFANNAVDDAGIGGTNVDVGATMGSWFTGLATGDFHLSAAGAGVFADIAQWQAGDPVTDIDGDPVPNMTPSAPGYDQP